jgi:hypothetical protein
MTCLSFRGPDEVSKTAISIPMLGEFAILVKGNRMEAVAVKTNTDKIRTTPVLIVPRQPMHSGIPRRYESHSARSSSESFSSWKCRPGCNPRESVQESLSHDVVAQNRSAIRPSASGPPGSRT